MNKTKFKYVDLVSPSDHRTLAGSLPLQEPEKLEKESESLSQTALYKRLTGQYYTIKNPFQHEAFMEWARSSGLKHQNILEPFAGSNSLIHYLQSMGLVTRFQSYDIQPADKNVQARNTLDSFPSGHSVCVTNPPWLARNSASFRGLPFPKTRYDNLYKYALEKCLRNCDWVASIIPESFLSAGVFHDRLLHCISLSSKLFKETGHPTCLALFGPDHSKDAIVWADGEKIGSLDDLNALRPQPLKYGPSIFFNREDGNLGLIALDNTVEASIRFCSVAELKHYKVKPSGRHITKISIDCVPKIDQWNRYLNQFRTRTKDVLMTCYKGIRKDGMYRRRLDWKLARGIIHNAN